MIRIDRLFMVQAVAIASAMVAAVIGGLLAHSWIWAVACAIFVYAGFSVAVMFWLSHRFRSDFRWRDRRESVRDADEDVYGDDDGYGWEDGDSGEAYARELSRRLGSHDPGQRVIESDPDD